VVPNDVEGLLSVEADGIRHPAEERILGAGYGRLAHEPIFLEPNLTELLGVGDQYFFHQRPAAG
jgi:hypothetical protein